jgi:hypothetical protein
MLDYLANGIGLLGGSPVERGDDLEMQWARIPLFGEDFLLLRQPDGQDGVKVYAHRTVDPDPERGLMLFRQALAINLGTAHGDGPVYCLEDGTDRFVAVLLAQGAHPGEVLSRMEHVARQLAAWTGEGLLLEEQS